MNRDYRHINKYLDEITARASGHKKVDYHWKWGNEFIDEFIKPLTGVQSILDVGCGEGYFTEALNKIFPESTVIGITVNQDDLKVSEANRILMVEMDFTFTGYHDQSFDLIFARHVLEHSFSPLLSLMEWKRLLKTGGYLGLVVPTYPNMLDCVTHWYVLTDMQLKNLLIRVGGMDIIKQKAGDGDSRETRYLIQKTGKAPLITMDKLTEQNNEYRNQKI